MIEVREMFEAQREWSSDTFGAEQNATGVIDHIKKELAEILESPTDAEEWADLFILAMDGLWRSGNELDVSYFDGLGAFSTLKNEPVGELLDLANNKVYWLRASEQSQSAQRAWIELMSIAAWGISICGGRYFEAVPEKQAKNRARDWPAREDQDPTKAIEHIR